MTIEDLQKALDNRPNLYKIPSNLTEHLKFETQIIEWFEDFARKFAAYRAELEKNPTSMVIDKFPRLNAYAHDKDVSRKALEEYTEKLIDWAADAEELLVKLFREEKVLPIDVWLKQNAKTYEQLHSEWVKCYNEEGMPRLVEYLDSKWVSVPEISQRLNGKVLVDPKRLTDFRARIVQIIDGYAKTDPIGNTILINYDFQKVFDETFSQETDKSMVLVDRKNLEDLKEQYQIRLDSVQESHDDNVWLASRIKFIEELLLGKAPAKTRKETTK